MKAKCNLCGRELGTEQITKNRYCFYRNCINYLVGINKKHITIKDLLSVK